MKFALGTVVIIRPDLIGDETYGGIYFNSEMERFCGLSATVERYSFGEYRLSGIDGIGEWIFSEEMLINLSMEGDEFYKLGNYPHHVASEEEANCKGNSLIFELLTDIFGVGKSGDKIRAVVIGDNIWLAEDYLPMVGILSKYEGKEYKEEEK